MYDEFDLYSRPYDLGEEEEELKRQRLLVAEPPPPPSPPPEEEPPAPPGFVDIAEEEPSAPSGFIDIKEPEEPPAPPGFVDVVEEPLKPPTPPGLIGRPGLFTEEPEPPVGVIGPHRPPEGGRPEEIAYRVKRGARLGTEDAKAAANQMASNFLSAEQNLYVGKSVVEAKADISKLEEQIAATEKELSAVGGRPDLAGTEWYYEVAPEQREQSQKLSGLRNQLGQAKQAATGGPVTESFAGSLSRAAAEEAEAARDRKKEIKAEYGDLIKESRNGEYWMQVADSAGQSLPSMGASMLNPAFGLAFMYAQTFETSRAEFLEKGGDPAKADEVGHMQAALQVPWEIFGELAVVNLAKATIKRLVDIGAGANPKDWAKWIGERATDLTKAAVGEAGVTTPAQTIIEQEVGEVYGYKPHRTPWELAGDVAKASRVALGQVGVSAGGPVAVEAAVRGAQQPATPVVSPAVPPAGVAVPPIVPPAGAVSPAGAVAPGAVPPGAPPVVPSVVPGTPLGAVPPGVPPVAPPMVPGAIPSTAAAPPALQPGQQVQGIVTGQTGTVINVKAAGTVEVDWGDGAGPQEVLSGFLTSAGAPTTPAGRAAQYVQTQNAVVKQVADQQAQKLQAANAPKTAEAIQQVAGESNQEASVTAAQYLEQAQRQAAAATGAPPTGTAAAAPPVTPTPVVTPPPLAPAAPPPIPGAVAPVPPGQGVSIPVMITRRMEADLLVKGIPQEQINRMTPAQAHEALAPAPVVAPAPAAPGTEPHAVVVGGQVFTGDTPTNAALAAQNAVGPDAMRSAQTGWVDPGTGRFVSHDIYDAHLALNTAIDQSGGNMEAPVVAEAQAQFAEAQARDEEVNSQIVSPTGEQVVQTGIKQQEAIISVRPSQELAAPLAGVNVPVAGVDAQGQPVTARQSAAQALNDARNDRTACQILLNCLT